LRVFLKYNYGALLWALFILTLLFSPLGGVSGDHHHLRLLDKLIHAGFFSMFCYLSITGRFRQFRFSIRRQKVPLESLVFCTLFGVFTEIGQYFLHYRSFDPWDMLANFAGALAGFLYFRIGIEKKLDK
jgi:VanZ family protein